MFANITGWHALIVIAVVLLLVGATRLPALARSVGQSMRILREESRNDEPPAGDSADSDGPAIRRGTVEAGRGS